MIDGCLAWQRVGLAPPAVVRAATEEYLWDQDAFAAWAAERLDFAPLLSERPGALLDDFTLGPRAVARRPAAATRCGIGSTASQASPARRFAGWTTSAAALCARGSLSREPARVATGGDAARYRQRARECLNMRRRYPSLPLPPHELVSAVHPCQLSRPRPAPPPRWALATAGVLVFPCGLDKRRSCGGARLSQPTSKRSAAGGDILTPCQPCRRAPRRACGCSTSMCPPTASRSASDQPPS